MALQQYSLKDVAINNGIDNPNIWIIVNNMVYDVTKFVDEHPGGKELVLEHAGKDATKDFKDAGHSSDAKRDLKNYLIGELAEEDRGTKLKNGIKPVNNVIISEPENTKKSSFCCC